MRRRRFLTLGIGAAVAASAPAWIGPARGAASEAGSTLAAYDAFGDPTLRGRVASAGDLIPPGAAIRSARDALPAARVRTRLAAALTALLGDDAWRRICRPGDVVALKLNALAAPGLAPRPELVAALVEGIRSTGVAAGDIILWDRTTRELARAGFPRQTSAGAVRAYGSDALRGGGYARELESCGAVGSLVSRILTDYATVLVNVGVLKDHDLAGVSAGMKNLYGVIHNPNRYHDNACSPYVADVAALPSVRQRLRLTVIDAVVGQAHGGPAHDPRWSWPCNRLLLGVDPVAVDSVARDWISAQRAARGLPTLSEAGRDPRWLAVAAARGLGQAAAIELVEV